MMSMLRAKRRDLGISTRKRNGRKTGAGESRGDRSRVLTHPTKSSSSRYPRNLCQSASELFLAAASSLNLHNTFNSAE